MSNQADWPSTHVSLIQRLREPRQSGDWELFVATYSPLLYRYCRRRGLQDADAHDVLQNVLVAVRRGIERFDYDPERGKFRRWLGTIALHELVRCRRAAQKAGRPEETLAELPDPRADDESVWDAEFNRYVFERALENIRPRFSDDTWRAFEQTWLRQRPVAEVAAELGQPAAWVYRARHRVVKRLKTEVYFLAADDVLPSRD
jgi:RNA polymerase sigma-70 factor (ECF subfamily)